MDIKLDIYNRTINKNNRQEIKNVNPMGQTQVRNEMTIRQKSDYAVAVQSDLVELSRIVVLRCGTVMLQNYTEDLSEPGRQLKLVREPDNPYDRWATRVCTSSGTMLGYLPSWKNQSVARLMDAGKMITVFVDETLNIPEPSPAHYSPENATLPLVLYMDVQLQKER